MSKIADDDRRLLTPAQVAARLGKGKRWVEDQARAGKIPHRRIGRDIRFTEDDVAAFVASTATGEADPNPWGLTPRSASRRAS